MEPRRCASRWLIEAGIKDLSVHSWQGVAAPEGLVPELRQKIHGALVGGRAGDDQSFAHQEGAASSGDSVTRDLLVQDDTLQAGQPFSGLIEEQAKPGSGSCVGCPFYATDLDRLGCAIGAFDICSDADLHHALRRIDLAFRPRFFSL